MCIILPLVLSSFFVKAALCLFGLTYRSIIEFWFHGSRSGQTEKVNLYHVSKYSLYFSFTIHYTHKKIDSPMADSSIEIVSDGLFLLISKYEKLST